MTDFFLLGSKITDGDCSHEIRRPLLLSRTAMTNLVSRSKGFILPTKVYIIKAMVFSVVIYGCSGWTLKKQSKEELMLLKCDAGGDP